MEKWVDVEFESSTTKTEQFKSFAKDFKKNLKKQIGSDFEIDSFSVGHFDLSMFLKSRDNKYIYLSSGDVRFSVNGWYNNLLIRTAENNKDYTGGSNNFVKFEEVKEKANNLIR